jgi:hypothetical protein
MTGLTPEQCKSLRKGEFNDFTIILTSRELKLDRNIMCTASSVVAELSAKSSKVLPTSSQ